jgi:hypothetical protein
VLLVVPSGGIPNMVLFEMLGGDTHHATCQNPELRSICLLRGEMGVDDDEEKIAATPGGGGGGRGGARGGAAAPPSNSVLRDTILYYEM